MSRLSRTGRDIGYRPLGWYIKSASGTGLKQEKRPTCIGENLCKGFRCPFGSR